MTIQGLVLCCEEHQALAKEAVPSSGSTLLAGGHRCAEHSWRVGCTMLLSGWSPCHV